MLGGEARKHVDQGVMLDGTMVFVNPGVPSVGNTLIPMEQRCYHIPSMGWLSVGGFLPDSGWTGGTFRVEWWYVFAYTGPGSTVAVRVGTPGPFYPANQFSTTMGSVLLNSSATSGTFDFTLAPGERPVIIVSNTNGPPGPPPHPSNPFWISCRRL
jgi:hypothetical protein